MDNLHLRRGIGIGISAVLLVLYWNSARPKAVLAASLPSGDGNRMSAAIEGCPMFPADNIWNARVDGLPVHERSVQWIDTIGRYEGFHMDFGSGTWAGGPIGIPYNIADAGTATYSVDFHYADESDPGPYPIPDVPLIEYGSDHHLLTVDRSTCILYELFDAEYSGGQWHAGSGAIWDLNSNDLRPAGWTSADAAGLPILPGLVRYDEIVAGEIHHAIRFTASSTNGYIWPARHLTSNNPAAPHIPPMGARFRLKASYDMSGFTAELQVILAAMQRYGIILADNGAPWFVSGAPDERWDNDMLHDLDVLTGNDFEAVDALGLMVDPDSGKAATAGPPGEFNKTAPADEAYVTTDPTLSWGSSSDADSYEYCIDTTDNDSCDASWISASTAQSAALNGLTEYDTYYWQVRAVNLAGTAYADGGTWWSFTALPVSFADVSTSHWAWSWIERLYHQGITNGCATSPLRYCPEDVTLRSEMAVFLLRAVHGSGYTPPAGTGTVFADVDLSHWAVDWIERLYAEGITNGCATSPLRYCPEQSVLRSEMAVFLLRSTHGSGYTPPAGTGTVFADVDLSHWAVDWIERLYAEGITNGCATSPLRYCPEQSTLRSEMAVFLGRAFGLP